MSRAQILERHSELSSTSLQTDNGKPLAAELS